MNGKFISQAYHNRRSEVYNDRLGRWEEEMDKWIITKKLALTQNAGSGKLFQKSLDECFTEQITPTELATQLFATR